MFQQIQDATDGFLVYLAMLSAAILLVLTNFERMGGVFYRIAERRRVAAAERQGADIAIMKRQIKYLTEREAQQEAQLEQLRRDLRAARDEVVDFHEWAYDVQKAAADGGIDIPDPPRDLDER